MLTNITDKSLEYTENNAAWDLKKKVHFQEKNFFLRGRGRVGKLLVNIVITGKSGSPNKCTKHQKNVQTFVAQSSYIKQPTPVKPVQLKNSKRCYS